MTIKERFVFSYGALILLLIGGFAIAGELTFYRFLLIVGAPSFHGVGFYCARFKTWRRR